MEPIALGIAGLVVQRRLGPPGEAAIMAVCITGLGIFFFVLTLIVAGSE